MCLIDGGVLRGFWKCGGWFDGGWLAGVSVKIVFCPDLAVWGEFLIDFISSFAVDDEDEVSGGYERSWRLIWGRSVERLLFSNCSVKAGFVGVLRIPA